MTTKRRAPEKTAMWQWKRALEMLGFDVSLLSQPFRAAQTKGLPDMYIRHPKYQVRLWVEAKVKPNKLTPDQKEWLRRERAAGGNAIVAYELSDILKALREAGVPIT